MQTTSNAYLRTRSENSRTKMENGGVIVWISDKRRIHITNSFPKQAFEGKWRWKS